MSERWPKQRSEGDSAEQAVRRLLEACKQWLEEQQEISEVSEVNAALFARTVVEHIHERQRRVAKKDAAYIYDKYCKPAFAKYSAIQVLVDYKKAPFDLICDQQYLEVAEVADEFFEAAAARPGSLVKHLGRFQRRVQAFIERRARADEDFMAETREMMNLDEADFDRLLQRCSLAKWRTYTDDQLRRIGANYKSWHLRVESLAATGPRPANEAQANNEIKRKITESVKRKWKGDPGDLAVQIDEAIRTKLPRYTYEAPLGTFLSKVVYYAIYELAGGPPVPPEETGGNGDDGDTRGVDITDPELTMRWLTILEQWTLRYWLAVCTFGPDLRPAMRVVWAETIDKALAANKEQVAKNDQIADRIFEETGERKTSAYVALQRNRLRKRLNCLEYVFDQTAARASSDTPGEELPGDESLLEAVEQECGGIDQVPQLRRVAALGRAARTLGNIYHVIRGVLARERHHANWQDALAEFIRQQQIEDQLMSKVNEQDASKLDNIRQLNSTQVRQALREGRASFFEDAVLILLFGERWAADTIVETLNPSPTECAAIILACQN
jgi:uncharacterized membrane protein YheB (UPF0754 family)